MSRAHIEWTTPSGEVVTTFHEGTEEEIQDIVEGVPDVLAGRACMVAEGPTEGSFRFVNGLNIAYADVYVRVGPED